MASRRKCDRCGLPVTGGPCAFCLLDRDTLSPEMGARPLWEDLGEGGDDFGYIAGFALIRRLGEGGMGEVYLARQLGTGRRVAIKWIRTAVPPARFRKEVDAMAALQHPGIVSVLDAGEHGGRPYLAMDYVDGPDLSVVLREEAPSVRKAVELTVFVARAMEHAHAQGILHRDLKPQNILMGPDGLPRVTDFGLARFLGGALQEGLTVNGARLGTPAYMAPEQVLGQRDLEGPWTDVYGLGATLYALITGVAPFRADSVEGVFQQVLGQDPVSPRVLRPGLSREVETMVLGALEKQVSVRYRSMGDWADELERWLRGEPIARQPAGMGGRLVKWARRKPALASLTLALLAVTLAGAAAVTWQWRQTGLANVGLVRSLSARCMAAVDGLIRGQPDLSEAIRMSASHLREVPEDRVVARFLLDRLSRDVFPIPVAVTGPGSGGLGTVQWSPDGRSLAVISELTVEGHAGMRSWDLDEGRWTSPLQALGPIPGEVRYSADGQWLATSFGGVLRLWESFSLESAGTLLEPANGTPAFAWHPTKPELFGLDPNGLVYRCEAATRVTRWETRVGGFPTALSVSGDGLRLAVGFAQGGGELLDASDGRILRPWGNPGHPVVGLASDAAGGHLGVLIQTGADEMSLHRVRIADGQVVGPISGARSVAFSPDGQWLLGGGVNPVLMDAASDEPVARRLRGSVVSANAWVNGGRRIVVSVNHRAALILDATSGEPLSQPVWSSAPIEDLVPSPDGSRLAVVAYVPEAPVWDIQPPVLAPRRLPAAHSLRFHPGAKELVTGGTDGQVRWWSGQDWSIETRSVPMSGPARTLAFGKQGNCLFVASDIGDVRLLTGKKTEGELRLDWTAGAIAAAAFSDDGKVLAVLGVHSKLRFYRVADGAALGPVIAVDLGRESTLGTRSWAVAFVPGTQQAVVGGYSHTLTVWDPVDPNPVAEIRHPLGAITSVIFPPGGNWMATGSLDGFVRLWNTKNWSERVSPMSHGDSVGALALDPKSSRLASAGAGGLVRIWDPSQGSAIREMRWESGDGNAMIRHLAFSPDGSLLSVVAGDGWVRVFDMNSGTLALKPLKLQGAGVEAAWAGDGQILAVSAESGDGWLVPIPCPDRDAPEWLPRLAEVLSGSVTGNMALREWEECRRKALGSSSTGFYRRWAEWFFVRRLISRDPVW